MTSSLPLSGQLPNNNEEINVISTSGNILLQSSKFWYEWIIDDFNLNMAEILNSAHFSIPSDKESRCFMQIFPKEKISHRVKSFTISLQILELCKSRVRVNFSVPDSLGVIPENNNSNYVENKAVPTIGWGTPKCIIQTFAFDTNRGLPENKLLIRVDITTDENYESKLHIQPECTLVDDFNDLLENQKFCDLTISIQGREFRAHKAILAARSPVFRAMFEHNMLENLNDRVVITDVTEDVMQEMLRFIYTGETKNIKNICFELLAASDKYGLERLKWMCEKKVFNLLKVENAAEILNIADIYDAIRLKGQTMVFIEENADHVMESRGWEAMIRTNPRLIAQVCRAIATKKYIPERRLKRMKPRVY